MGQITTAIAAHGKMKQWTHVLGFWGCFLFGGFFGWGFGVVFFLVLCYGATWFGFGALGCYFHLPASSW